MIQWKSGDQGRRKKLGNMKICGNSYELSNYKKEDCCKRKIHGKIERNHSGRENSSFSKAYTNKGEILAFES